MNDEPVVVFSGSYAEAGIVKGLLEESGIQAFVLNEFLGTMAPWYIGPGGVDAVKVVVAARVVESARGIVDAFMSGGADT